MRTIKVIGILALVSQLYALDDGFDFGGEGTGCDGGSGTFEQSISDFEGDYENVVTVGEIPVGLKDVQISLKSDKDVDIRLYAEDGEKIVHWPYGMLNGANKATGTYNGVSIEYSGYNGDGTGLGHEYITIAGTTQNSFTMKAFGYKAGFAKVDYSWSGKENCTATPTESGSGDFKQSIVQDDIVSVGDIPVGVNNLTITLKSENDVDIQLYDKDNGMAIVKWASNMDDFGILSSDTKQTTNYEGMEIEWSGYNGDGTGVGNEYIKITGLTTKNLTMKAFGYQAGEADIHYEWGALPTTEEPVTEEPITEEPITEEPITEEPIIEEPIIEEPIIEEPVIESSCPTITNENFTDVFPSADVKWSASGSGVSDIAAAFNNARSKDSTISKELIMPSQSEWDTMSNQQKALYLTNRERYDRGIKPFEGVDANVVSVAQNYAQLLYDTGKFGHTEDGSPWNRLDSVDLIKNNKDFFAYGENLAAMAGSNYQTNPIAKSIYMWIYDDSGSAWGHRKFSLATLDDNSGEAGAEGLIGFGIVEGDNYGLYEGWKSSIVVMNAFDPSSSWNHTNTQKVSICTPNN